MLIEMTIKGLMVDPITNMPIVMLKDLQGDRVLPIWVGIFEANAIALQIENIATPRPMTHDLLKNVFGAFNARLKRVEIVKMQDDIYYGNIVAEVDGIEIDIDSRPSDAIAIAVRAHVPILVASSVMDEAGIIPEQDMPEGAEASAEPERSEPAPLSEESTERLSVFEDFLEKLDFDKPDDENKSDDDPSDKPKKPKAQ